MKKTLGGERLGSGQKMTVDLHGFGRSTHDLGYLWRSTMSAGTLVPFMSMVGLPGDTFDVKLNSECLTLPTVGPLFGSFKAQYDLFVCPIRLYQGLLHNNKLGIGLKMQDVKLPIFELQTSATPLETWNESRDLDNSQINPSCIFSYLGLRGIGVTEDEEVRRSFNGLPWLSYWDVYKNYYAMKSEEIGAVVHTPAAAVSQNIDEVEGGDVPEYPSVGNQQYTGGSNFTVTVNTGLTQDLRQIWITTDKGAFPLLQMFDFIQKSGDNYLLRLKYTVGNIIVRNWYYADARTLPYEEPQVQTFDLSELDNMREAILRWVGTAGAFKINDSAGAADTALYPFQYLLERVISPELIQPYMFSQEGLGLKTYQSDLFNNWMNTEWIDGVGGINEITRVDTTAGYFSIDTVILARKVYDMLNRIAVSGGSYDDWIDAVYMTERHRRAETPIYVGGLSKELVFQEVISNSQSSADATGSQPLGTLAGRGKFGSKHKGGNIVIHIEEPSYILGIVSLTPRIDYSQGNSWDLHLKTMDDFHKPSLDEIGFQEATTEDMAWWSAYWDGDFWRTGSAGKQPAWIKYMTSVNKNYGDFAIQDNSMFMVLNRRYRHSADTGKLIIDDLTTYIDPAKYNHIFAQTSLDSQNFWMQIAVDITARRVMSAKVMPNL